METNGAKGERHLERAVAVTPIQIFFNLFPEICFRLL